MKLPIQSESVFRNASSQKVQLTMNNLESNGIQPSQFSPINIRFPLPPERATCGNLSGLTCWVNSKGNCVCSDILTAPA